MDLNLLAIGYSRWSAECSLTSVVHNIEVEERRTGMEKSIDASILLINAPQ
jgi:hypothetical protein